MPVPQALMCPIMSLPLRQGSMKKRLILSGRGIHSRLCADGYVFTPVSTNADVVSWTNLLPSVLSRDMQRIGILTISARPKNPIQKQRIRGSPLLEPDRRDLPAPPIWLKWETRWQFLGPHLFGGVW